MYKKTMHQQRQNVGTLLAAIAFTAAVLLATAVPVDANNGNGQGGSSDRGNSYASEADPLEVTEVTEQTSDPGQSNFEEEFTFYRVTYEEVTYDEWVYREPARLGGSNFTLSGLDNATSDRFWYSISAADSDGVQHEIAHQGRVTQYFVNEDEDEVRSLTAQFNGQGELQHVNGVTPTKEDEE